VGWRPSCATPPMPYRPLNRGLLIAVKIYESDSGPRVEVVADQLDVRGESTLDPDVMAHAAAATWRSARAALRCAAREDADVPPPPRGRTIVQPCADGPGDLPD